jgi:single-strand DNA-binding protein
MLTMSNQVKLIGYLGSDPEIRHSASLGKIVRLRLATQERCRTATGEDRLRTHWHNLMATGEQAELAEKWLSKGKRVAVRGRLVQSSVTNGEGQLRKFSVIEITGLRVPGMRA